MIASGAGTASQRAIGTGMLGGMLSATLLGVIFVPVRLVWVLSHDRKQSDAPMNADASSSSHGL